MANKKISRKWRLTDRTRLLLTLELAIILPAASLMAFSMWNLQHMQRDKAIEAAISRDFSHVLKIAEQKSWEKMSAVVGPVRKDFPCAQDGARIKSELDAMLTEHPEFLYAIFYDQDTNQLIWRSQPSRNNDEDFKRNVAETVAYTTKWLPNEAPDLAHRMRDMAQKEPGEVPMDFYGGWVQRGDRSYYYHIAYFVPTSAGNERVTLGVVGLDPDYLRNAFFPAVMKSVLTSKSTMLRNDPNPPAMMVRATKGYSPWVASPNWDGGKAEVDRSLQSIFPDMTIAIKYPGTTIDEIGAKFMDYNYLVLAALCIVMAGGIFLTYRNVSREMNLARLKSDFVANVSHELRTPLALIRLYAETLELGRLTAQEKYQEYFRIIREESERLTALINNILDFSRIEAGRKEYDFKETNLAELVRATLDSYRFQIEQNGFKFEENIANDLPPVNVDREAIARSLLNLVNNALKYSKDQKYIGVKLYRANGSVKLEVRDRGIGIAPGEQDKIFEKFYRCGDPLVHNIKGSGLGLSLVRHIAQAHGGDVSVESAPEKGSKFTIALPIDPSARMGTAPA